MNKEKYLKEIEKRLNYLTDEQKQNEIFRISNDLDNGKIMNDISIEVNEIYKKYNINPEKLEKKNNKENKKDNTSFISMIKSNSVKENLIAIRDIIIIVLLISFLKIPFIGIETALFSVFRDSINDNIYTIIHYILEVLYIIFAITLFIKIFKRRFKKEEINLK